MWFYEFCVIHDGRVYNIRGRGCTHTHTRTPDLTDKMKRRFFQAAVTSILLYGCTTWTLTKRLEKKLDGNYTRMLRAILNKSWRQHPTRHQLYGHLPPITKTIQVGRTRHAGHCWRSRDELIRDVLLWLDLTKDWTLVSKAIGGTLYPPGQRVVKCIIPKINSLSINDLEIKAWEAIVPF